MPTPIAGCATRCAICWARSPASTESGASGRERDAGAGALGAAPLAELDGEVRAARIDDYDFHAVHRAAQFLRRRSVGLLFRHPQGRALLRRGRDRAAPARDPHGARSSSSRCLTAWLAPILCFTAEEAWLRAAMEDGEESVHLRVFPEMPDGLARRCAGRALGNESRDLRRVVTGALEVERAAKRIGSSLQAHPTVYAPADYARRRRRARSGRARHHLRRRPCAVEAPPPGAFTLPDVPGIGVVVAPARGRQMRALLAGADRGRPSRPGRDSASAAPMPSWRRWRRQPDEAAASPGGSAVAALVIILDQLSKPLMRDWLPAATSMSRPSSIWSAPGTRAWVSAS